MNPYNENTNQLKNFFRSPVVLIAAIFSFLSAIVSTVVDAVPQFGFKDNAILNMISAELTKLAEKYNLGEGDVSGNSSGSFTAVMPLLIGVALLLFFIMSRTESGSLKSPITVFKVNAVLQVVLSIITSVFLLLFGVVVIAENTSYGILIMFTACGFAAFLLLYSFAQLFFVNSIKKSCNSIYIVKSDSALIFAVTSIVTALVSATIQLYLTLHASSDQSVPIVANWCSTGLSCLSNILIAVVAFKYYFYVRSITEDLVIEPENSDIIEDDSDLPYEGVKGIGADIKKCRSCGKPLGKDDYFCNYCGTTVEK